MSPFSPTSTLADLTSSVQVVPRTLLDLYFRAARVPLDLAARAAGQQENTQWPPVTVFETAEAAIEAKVGGWLRDLALTSRSDLRRMKLEELDAAAALKEAAARERAQADSEFAERTQRAEDAKQQAANRAEAQKRDAEQAAANAERQAAARATEQAADAQRAQEKAAQQARRAERDRTLKALDQETRALAVAADAQSSQDHTKEVGKKIASNRAARKA